MTTMEVKLSKLNIGFGADVKVIGHNEFEITGDITINVLFEDWCTVNVKKIKVIYNHDGLLKHIYDGGTEPDRIRLFRDVETYAASSEGDSFEVFDDWNEIPLSVERSIEVYADIILYDDECC